MSVRKPGSIRGWRKAGNHLENWKAKPVLCERKQKWHQNNISGTNSFQMWSEERGRYFIHDKISEDYSGSENFSRGEKEDLRG